MLIITHLFLFRGCNSGKLGGTEPKNNEHYGCQFLVLGPDVPDVLNQEFFMLGSIPLSRKCNKWATRVKFEPGSDDDAAKRPINQT